MNRKTEWPEKASATAAEFVTGSEAPEGKLLRA